ncbi:type II secretion system minor pseudopilin GspK [Geotalea uraniireducens]|uniref:General secretion pathway protein K n=1 Tax=Geotalea uraniireducens (strain Rf4) TaxID=351605 RepID=A5GC16_GEOUR|nr:type II secretion system minor pseudopilin GspK [Geotalea uraniireducens]ABQ24888.1 General secretion pathway protein K [Geotalea uraniireducens Rf4]
MKDERGFALVITLIITALLVALAAEFVDEVYVDTSLSHNFVAGQQASILAASGVDGGIRLLQFDLAQQTYSSLMDRWAKPLKIEDEQGSLLVTIEEESGKLNINDFPQNGNLDNNFAAEVASRLFNNLKLKDSNSLIDALADWRGENEIPHTYGAKTQYYSTLKPPYEAKGGRLDTVEELALVKGFAGEPLKKLMPLVTVYDGVQGGININTAQQEIIEALDKQIDADKAKQVLAKRPFSNFAELGNALGSQSIASGLATKITFKGSVYRIHSEARVRETSRVVEAVVRISGIQSTVLYWR